MTWKTIRNAGYVLEQNALAQKYIMGKARTFLREITDTFIRSCANYFDEVEELPFIYRERQIQSILLPAIAKVADAAFVEQPINRKSKQGSQKGRIDYWVLYQKYVFLIELKHSWMSVASKRIRGDTNQAWSEVLHQLKSISKSEADSLCLYSKKIAKIGMMIVPCFQSAKDKNKLTPYDKSSAISVFEILIKSLRPTPNWSCVWTLHERLQTVHEYAGSRNEIYPFVYINTMVKTL